MIRFYFKMHNNNDVFVNIFNADNTPFIHFLPHIMDLDLRHNVFIFPQHDSSQKALYRFMAMLVMLHTVNQT